MSFHSFKTLLLVCYHGDHRSPAPLYCLCNGGCLSMGQICLPVMTIISGTLIFGEKIICNFFTLKQSIPTLILDPVPHSIDGEAPNSMCHGFGGQKILPNSCGDMWKRSTIFKTGPDFCKPKTREKLGGKALYATLMWLIPMPLGGWWESTKPCSKTVPWKAGV